MESRYSNIRTSAQEYVKFNLPIHPLCPHNHKDMDSEHINKCKSPGKAPILKSWSSRQETTMREAKKWWIENKYYNIGLVLGSTEHWNIIGIDIDGKEGYNHWLRMIEGQDVPPSWEYTTGHGYRILYYLPDNIRSKKKSEALDGVHQEVAFIGQGQQTVIPPSIHPSGKLYEWVAGKSPFDIDIAMAPDWIIEHVKVDESFDEEVDAINSVNNTVVGAETVGVTEGSRDVKLTRSVGAFASSPAATYESVLGAARGINHTFQPPLEDAQVVKVVKSIWDKEIQKRQIEKNREQIKNKTIPINLTKGFLQYYNSQGRHFRYRKNRDIILTCTNHEGPWKIMHKENFNLWCTNYLRTVNPKLITPSKLSDIRTLLPSTLMDLYKTNGEEFDDMSVITDTICTQNGVLHWETGELVPWNPSVHLHTFEISAKWIDEPSREVRTFWEDTLDTWIDDPATVMFLQEYIGYMLLPLIDMRTAVFLYGSGANGKSLFIDIVSNLFDTCKKNITLSSISSKHGGVDIQDKLCLLCADADRSYLKDTGRIKEIIAGDSIRVEPKGKDSYDIKPYGKLLLSANDLPTSVDKSVGWYSRLQIVHFGKKFKTNGKFKVKLESMMRSEEGREVLLHWAIQGLRRFKSAGAFTRSAMLDATKKAYEETNDNVKAFLTACTTDLSLLDENDNSWRNSKPINALYKMYENWCVAEGMSHRVKRIDFTKKVSEIYDIKAVGFPNRTSGYTTIRCFTNMVFKKDLEKDLYDVYESNLHEKIDVHRLRNVK